MGSDPELFPVSGSEINHSEFTTLDETNKQVYGLVHVKEHRVWSFPMSWYPLFN